MAKWCPISTMCSIGAGSIRNIAIVEIKGSANLSIRGSVGVSVAIGTHIWIHWLNVASERHQAARVARERTLSLASQGVDSGDARRAELHASMVGISASAHAIDGLYGELKPLGYVPPALEQTWEQNRAPRHRRIFETLKTGCRLGAKTNAWPSQFEALYKLRDQVVHHELAHRPSVPHPSGLPNLNVAQEMADYCVENVAASLDLAINVAVTAIESPRQQAQEQWASGFLPDWPPLLRALASDQ